jgi:pimeloyl-ACP methyl ester carboxylesterase
MQEKIKILNNKGQTLDAVIHRPKEKTLRLAVLCPGYLDSKDYDHLVTLADLLANQGYTAVRFDPTGTWKSEGDISEYLTSQYLEDIKSVIEFMLGQDGYTHILLGGHSRGAQVSIMYAAKDSRVSEVLSIMPSTPKTMVGERYDQWKERGYEISKRVIPGTKEIREFGVSYAHVTDRQKFNIFDEVKKVHVPLVLIAGETDAIALPEDVKQIYDLANEPKKFILIEGIGHDYRNNPSEIDTVNKKVLEAITFSSR